MVRRNIKIGDREFSVAVPLRLGTLRRVPGAIQAMSDFKDPANVTAAFIMGQFDTFVAIVYDAINADAIDAKKELVISADDFNALVNGGDAFEMMNQLSDAVIALVDRIKPPATTGEEGNASSSESKS